MSSIPSQPSALVTFHFALAEGARFELAVHEVDAGFQDRCLKPLGHPSDSEINYLAEPLRFCLTISLTIFGPVPNSRAMSSGFRSM